MSIALFLLQYFDFGFYEYERRLYIFILAYSKILNYYPIGNSIISALRIPTDTKI